MSHFMMKCKDCDGIITQCRCPDPNKTVTYVICDSCKSKPKIVSEAPDLTKFYIAEIDGVLENIPNEYKVYVKTMDEHHSRAATLAISVAKLVRALEEK